MSLTSEEYYLSILKNKKENYEERLKTEFHQDTKDFIEYLIEEIDEEIERVKQNITENKEIEDED